MNSKDFSVIFCRPVYRFFEGDPAVFREINSDDDSMEGFHGMTGLVFEWASLPEKADLCANRIALFRLSSVRWAGPLRPTRNVSATMLIVATELNGIRMAATKGFKWPASPRAAALTL
jgi:hypothetical protein